MFYNDAYPGKKKCMHVSTQPMPQRSVHIASRENTLMCMHGVLDSHDQFGVAGNHYTSRMHVHTPKLYAIVKDLCVRTCQLHM